MKVLFVGLQRLPSKRMLDRNLHVVDDSGTEHRLTRNLLLATRLADGQVAKFVRDQRGRPWLATRSAIEELDFAKSCRHAFFDGVGFRVLHRSPKLGRIRPSIFLAVLIPLSLATGPVLMPAVDAESLLVSRRNQVPQGKSLVVENPESTEPTPCAFISPEVIPEARNLDALEESLIRAANKQGLRVDHFSATLLGGSADVSLQLGCGDVSQAVRLRGFKAERGFLIKAVTLDYVAEGH